MNSIAEEEDQIEPGPLNAPERDALIAAGGFREGSLEPEEFGNLIFENELGGLLGAEGLSNPEVRPRAHLLPDAQARPEAALALRLDLELVEIQRVADRSG